jgi:hypothetical protein
MPNAATPGFSDKLKEARRCLGRSQAGAAQYFIESPVVADASVAEGAYDRARNTIRVNPALSQPDFTRAYGEQVMRAFIARGFDALGTGFVRAVAADPKLRDKLIEFDDFLDDLAENSPLIAGLPDKPEEIWPYLRREMEKLKADPKLIKLLPFFIDPARHDEIDDLLADGARRLGKPVRKLDDLLDEAAAHLPHEVDYLSHDLVDLFAKELAHRAFWELWRHQTPGFETYHRASPSPAARIMPALLGGFARGMAASIDASAFARAAKDPAFAARMEDWSGLPVAAYVADMKSARDTALASAKPPAPPKGP